MSQHGTTSWEDISIYSLDRASNALYESQGYGKGEPSGQGEFRSIMQEVMQKESQAGEAVIPNHLVPAP